jgi:hypothetical protein
MALMRKGKARRGAAKPGGGKALRWQSEAPRCFPQRGEGMA